MGTGYIVWNVTDKKIEAGPFIGASGSANATAALKRVQKTNQGGQGGVAKKINYTTETVTV